MDLKHDLDNLQISYNKMKQLPAEKIHISGLEEIRSKLRQF